jgi:hypothetical protein
MVFVQFKKSLVLSIELLILIILIKSSIVQSVAITQFKELMVL